MNIEVIYVITICVATALILLMGLRPFKKRHLFFPKEEKERTIIEIDTVLLQEILDFIKEDALYMYGEYGGYDNEKSEEAQMPELWHKLNNLKPSLK